MGFSLLLKQNSIKDTIQRLQAMLSSIPTTAPQLIEGHVYSWSSYSIVSKWSPSDCPRKSSQRHRTPPTIGLRTRGKISLGIRYLLNPDKTLEMSIFSMFWSFAVVSLWQHKGWIWHLFDRLSCWSKMWSGGAKRELRSVLKEVQWNGAWVIFVWNRFKPQHQQATILGGRRSCQARVQYML